MVYSQPGSSVRGNSPGKNTGMSCHALLQGNFPIQGSNPGLPHCRQILYYLSPQGSPRILEWLAYPFSRGSSWARSLTRISCIAGGFFTSWGTRKALFSARSCQTLLWTSWTVAHQDPLFMAFPRQEYWIVLPIPSLGDLPNSEIEPTFPTLAAKFFTTEPQGEPSGNSGSKKERQEGTRNIWNKKAFEIFSDVKPQIKKARRTCSKK